MRIGIDGRELMHQRTGVGRYLAELCGQFLASPRSDKHEFVVYTPTGGSDFSMLGSPFDSQPRGCFRHRSVPGRTGTWWEQVDLVAATRRDDLDLFFAPAYSAPLRLTVPSVVTMHDVSFTAHPEWFGWREGFRRRWLARQSLRYASTIISDSNFTKTEMLRLFDIPPHRVRVVYPGITPRPAGPATPGSDPLILFVGSLFNRRHLPTLIRAFALVRRQLPDAQLTLVGDNRTDPFNDLSSLSRQYGTAEATALLSYVTEVELDALYCRARVFTFLSEYEGFGLTPLEAMSAGVPAVVADTPVARELYGDAAWFVPIADPAATARAIVALLTDRDLHDRQRRLGDEVVLRYSWKRAADETLDVFESALTTRSRA